MIPRSEGEWFSCRCCRKREVLLTLLRLLLMPLMPLTTLLLLRDSLWLPPLKPPSRLPLLRLVMRSSRRKVLVPVDSCSDSKSRRRQPMVGRDMLASSRRVVADAMTQ